MAFCSNCGTELKNNAKFCTNCGTSVVNNPATVEASATTDTVEIKSTNTATESVKTTQPVQPKKVVTKKVTKEEFTKKMVELNNTEDLTSEYDEQDIQDNKVYAVLAYFGPLVLIPILLAKESKFAKFHSNQGLVLMIAEIAFTIIYTVLSTVIIVIAWQLGIVVSIVGLLAFVFPVLAIIGIINAAQGRAKELPIVGKIRLLK